MLYQYSDKKKILFDRSAFEKLTYSDIERVKTRFNILCPDVFLAECINPSKSARKKILEKKYYVLILCWYSYLKIPTKYYHTME